MNPEAGNGRAPRGGRRMLALACVALVAACSLSGCGLDRMLAREAGAIVANGRTTTLDCMRADRCALATPYRDLYLADLAAAEQGRIVHHVDTLERGEDALLLRVHLIRSARESIDVQTFIWTDDDAGYLIFAELVAAARRGVRVRVLIDQLFSVDNLDWLARLAHAHANFELRLFNPTFNKAVTPAVDFAAATLCCLSRTNHRMHNKLFLVDGGYGIAGGRNYQNRYFDWDQSFNYRDRDALVIGPHAGAQMQRSFEQFWNNPRAVPLTRLNDVNRRIVAGPSQSLVPPADVRWPRIESLRARASDIGYIRHFFVASALAVGQVDYFSDAPDKDTGLDSRQALTRQISELFGSARQRILLQTPYLVLSRQAQEEFAKLHRGAHPPEVVVSTNSLAATDAFYVYAISYKKKKRYMKRLGFRIHEFKPFPADAPSLLANYEELAGGSGSGRYGRYSQAPVNREGIRIGLHAKSIVIDERFTLIGSHNFDPRSDHYNTESGFIVDDPAFARRIAGLIERDLRPENSWTVARRPLTGPLPRINNALSDLSSALPLFDLWPFRFATNYEIRPGCHPLPANDPRFYDCYESVGDFPEVGLPLKMIYTRILTAFGVALEGFL